MDKNLLLAIIGVVIIVGGIFLLNNKTPEGIILFYGDGCSHCKTVDDFIDQNKIRDKVEFAYLEVYNNKNNSELLTEKAISCNIDTSRGVGIPFLWDGKNCFVGDDNIVNFFQDKIKQ
jgi:glutaredoxin